MNIHLTHDELTPIIRQVVAELYDRFGSDTDRIAYKEAEAAAMFGVESHVLKHARLRGEIQGAKVGRGWQFTRAELLRWFESRKGAE